MPVAGEPVPNAIGTGSAARRGRLRRGWRGRTGDRSLQERFLSGELSLNVYPLPKMWGAPSHVGMQAYRLVSLPSDSISPWSPSVELMSRRQGT